MKQIALFVVFTLTGLMTAADPPAAVTLRVRRLANVKDVERNWESSWGSYDRDFSRSLAVDIFIRNLRNTEEDVTLEVLFIAKPLSGSALRVFDRITESIKLDNTKPFHVVKISKQLEASVQNYKAIGTRYEYGSKIFGYIVRVLQGTRIVKVNASLHQLKRIGQNQKLLDKMIQRDNK